MEFYADLSAHEIARRLHMLAAAEDFSLSEGFTAAEQAQALLYSNLDETQQKIFDALKAAGVLP